ncbi:MAG: hypothetical protein JKY77_04205 [Rhizobiaceae bacterium]|nr:hypothetical protein [Rhizobiaceae bacterium]
MANMPLGKRSDKAPNKKVMAAAIHGNNVVWFSGVTIWYSGNPDCA